MAKDARVDSNLAHHESELCSAIDEIANQLCLAVDGNYDFSVNVESGDETVQKLQMLVNFLVDSTRRSLSELEAKIGELEATTHALSQTNEKLKCEAADRERTERALSRREAKLRTILNSALDPTFTIDSRGKILDVSQSVKRDLIWSPEELIGQTLTL